MIFIFQFREERLVLMAIIILNKSGCNSIKEDYEDETWSTE